MMRHPDDHLYDRFFKSLLDFIGALCDTYPKFVHLANMQMKLSLAMGQKDAKDFIWNNWNKFITKNADKISRKDPVLIGILAQEKIFSQADLTGKWKTATKGIKDAIWAHVTRLAECSSVYETCKRIPPASMDKLLSATQEIVTESPMAPVSHDNIARAMEGMSGTDIMGVYNSIPPGVLDMMVPMVQQTMGRGGGINPMGVMSMAQQMMQNPEFQSMAEKMAKDMGLEKR